MFKRNIFYAVAAFALTATAADFAKRTYTAEPEKIASQKSGSTAVETGHYGLGRPATPTDIAKHEYLVGPKGTGLPKAHGTARQGRAIYLQSCVACHGLHGEGTNEYPALVGGKGTLKSDNPLPTIGSYWPYATTVWDYVNRARLIEARRSLCSDSVSPRNKRHRFGILRAERANIAADQDAERRWIRS
jgi:cytochrome c